MLGPIRTGRNCSLIRNQFKKHFVEYLRSPEVDAGNGDVSKRRDLDNESVFIPLGMVDNRTYRLSWYWWLHAAIDADNIQNSALGGGCPEQTAPAT